jgi:hypothetical protein
MSKPTSEQELSSLFETYGRVCLDLERLTSVREQLRSRIAELSRTTGPVATENSAPDGE